MGDSPDGKEAKLISGFFVHHATIIVTVILIVIAAIILEIPFSETEIGATIKKWTGVVVLGLLALGLAEMIILCKNIDTKIKTIYSRSRKNTDFISDINNKLRSGNVTIRADNVVFEENKDRADNKIRELLNDGKVSMMRIICYGPRLFGEIISDVIKYNADHPKKVNLEVVICSSLPQSLVFEDDSLDKTMLRTAEETLKEKEYVKLFVSEVVPTVRVCIVTGTDGHPIYCYYQPYYFYPQRFTFKGYLPDKTLLHAQGYSPMIIANKDDEILKNLVDSCNHEFDRLSKCIKKRDKDGIIVNNIKGIKGILKGIANGIKNITKKKS